MWTKTIVGHSIVHQGIKIWIAGAKRRVTVTIRKKLKRRNAVKPVIGHMKTDGRLDRNFLKGIEGDAMNALLCEAEHKSEEDPQALGALLCPMDGIAAGRIRRLLFQPQACT